MIQLTLLMPSNSFRRCFFLAEKPVLVTLDGSERCPVDRCAQNREIYYTVQPAVRITTLGGASEKCSYPRSVLIPEVSLYVLQLDGTLLWAWNFCRYSRIVVISAVVMSEVDRIVKLEYCCVYCIVSSCTSVTRLTSALTADKAAGRTISDSASLCCAQRSARLLRGAISNCCSMVAVSARLVRIWSLLSMVLSLTRRARLRFKPRERFSVAPCSKRDSTRVIHTRAHTHTHTHTHMHGHLSSSFCENCGNTPSEKADFACAYGEVNIKLNNNNNNTHKSGIHRHQTEASISS